MSDGVNRNSRWRGRGVFLTDGYSAPLLSSQLKHAAAVNKYVKPIGLPKKDGKIPANIDCTVAGWGVTTEGRHVSAVLREAKEKMQFSFECKHIWQDNFNSTHMICTKFDKTKGGMCQVLHGHESQNSEKRGI